MSDKPDDEQSLDDLLKSLESGNDDTKPASDGSSDTSLDDLLKSLG